MATFDWSSSAVSVSPSLTGSTDNGFRADTPLVMLVHVGVLPAEVPTKSVNSTTHRRLLALSPAFIPQATGSGPSGPQQYWS